MSLTPQFNMKHILPKTRLANTIMYVNPSQDVHLATKLSQLDLDRRRVKVNLEMQQRAFCAELRRRSEQWVHEDEQRLLLMHLPVDRKRQKLNLGNEADVLYNSPRYNITMTADQEIERMTGPKLPVSKVVKDSFQIFKVNNETVCRRMPAHLKIKPKRMEQFNNYRGTRYLSSSLTNSDDRFVELKNLLSSNHGSYTKTAPQLNREKAFLTAPSRESTAPGLGGRSRSYLNLYVGNEKQRTVDNLLARTPLPPISRSNSQNSCPTPD